MEYAPQLFTLAGVMLLACMSPGPDFIAVTSHALASRRAGMGVAAGVAAACMIWAALAMFGLGLILTQIAWLYGTVRLAGAAYLIYLGGKILWSLRQTPQTQANDSAAPAPAATLAQGWAALRRGLLVGLTNPKSAAFFGSLFVTVLPVGAPLAVQGVTVAIVGLVASSWFFLVAWMFSVGGVRKAYAKARRGLDAAMGAVLIAIGVKLAVSE